MWGLVVMLVMASLTSYYALSNKSGQMVAAMPSSAPYAESMAQYREAVIAWFTAHPADTGSVSMSNLASVMPSWSQLQASPAAAFWRNHRAPSGVIYIYASPLPPVNIVPDLIERSRYSQYVGTFRTGDTTLFSPFAGDTGIPLPTGVTIPNGSPVWIAMRR